MRKTSQKMSQVRSKEISWISPPYSTNIAWAITISRPVFQANAQLQHQRRLHPTSVFWQHPVRYLPILSETNIYRTVMIDFIPLGTTVKQVLSVIHTGAIEKISLVNPIRGSTDFMTARVVFHHESAAQDLNLQARHDPIRINDHPVRVWLVLQPTYPKNQKLDEDVFMNCATRILIFDNRVAQAVITSWPPRFAHQLDHGDLVDVTPWGPCYVKFEFASVAEAVGAMEDFRMDPRFDGVVFDFEDDYCQQ